MTIRKFGGDPFSPYVAFKDDRERRRALVSRDVRWVLVALIIAIGGVPSSVWPAIWRLLGGG